MEPSWPFWPQNLIGGALLNDLKLNIFEKWRLGGLRARFWRPQGSILEGPSSIFQGFGTALLEPPKSLRKLDVLKNKVLEGSGLDFGGPRSRFWKLRGQFFRDFRMFLAMHAENLPRTCRELAEAHDACLDRYSSEA